MIVMEFILYSLRSYKMKPKVLKYEKNPENLIYKYVKYFKNIALLLYVNLIIYELFQMKWHKALLRYKLIGTLLFELLYD